MHGIAAARKEFDPRSMAGCRCWLRADRGVEIISNKVARWFNQVSGVLGDAVQDVTAKAPALSTGNNNRPCMLFTGVEGLRWALALSGPSTHFVVCRFTATMGVNDAWVMYLMNNGGTAKISEITTFGGYTKLTASADNTASTGTVGYSVPDQDQLLKLHSLGYNGGTNTSAASYNVTLNGADITLGTGGVVGPYSSFQSSIGAYVDLSNAITFGAKMELYEVIVFDRNVVAADRAALWGYVKTRYNL